MKISLTGVLSFEFLVLSFELNVKRGMIEGVRTKNSKLKTLSSSK
jgi:hypothetical protein